MHVDRNDHGWATAPVAWQELGALAVNAAAAHGSCFFWAARSAAGHSGSTLTATETSMSNMSDGQVTAIGCAASFALGCVLAIICLATGLMLLWFPPLA